MKEPWEAVVSIHSVSKELRESLSAVCVEAGLRIFHPAATAWHRWDLCVVTDHCFPDTYFDDRVPILFYYHGLSSAKKYGGENYKYSRKNTHDRFGRLKYAAFVEAGPFQSSYAIETNPDLVSVLNIVGDPFVDDFLKLDRNRANVRKNLGLKKEQKIIMIQSTWGALSLDALYGHKLYEECKDLCEMNEWLCVLSTHPSQWVDGLVEQNKSEYFLELETSRFRVLKPDEKRLDWLSAADFCISDVTSQSLLFALTGRPMLFVEMPLDTIDQNTELAKIMAYGPTWDGRSPISEAIQCAMDFPAGSGRRDLLQSICAFRGESSVKFTELTRDLIKKKQI